VLLVMASTVCTIIFSGHEWGCEHQ
jgi:hypothetical protein